MLAPMRTYAPGCITLALVAAIAMVMIGTLAGLW
jgi:hypothetical protein